MKYQKWPDGTQIFNVNTKTKHRFQKKFGILLLDQKMYLKDI